MNIEDKKIECKAGMERCEREIKRTKVIFNTSWVFFSVLHYAAFLLVINEFYYFIPLLLICLIFIIQNKIDKCVQVDNWLRAKHDWTETLKSWKALEAQFDKRENESRF